MILAAFACLVVAVIGFATHTVILGVIFIVLMLACGITGFLLAMSAYRKLKGETDQMLRDQAASKDRFIG